jgi:acetylornithine deacetylase/succinyl-diaminopimelate desuccinylase-like protein
MEQGIRELLSKLISLRSISSYDGNAKDLIETARVLRKFLSECNFSCQLHENYGPGPIIFAECGQHDAPLTLILYGHYDVQPAGPIEMWHTDPFVLTEKDGKFFGRGVADDKGPLVIMLWELCKIMQNSTNIRAIVLVEGGEEVGSPGFANFLSTFGSNLSADASIIVDSGCPDDATPALTTGLRSIITFEINLRTGDRDVHSGFGGCIPNAVQELTRLCGLLHENSGRVAVPHFYDDIAMPTTSELAAFKLEYNCDNKIHEKFGVRCLRNIFPPLLPNSIHALLPSLELHGICGGHNENGIKTIIPAEASAKFSVRIVSRQNPNLISSYVESFLRDNTPDYAEIAIKSSIAGNAYCVDFESASNSYRHLFKSMELSLESAFSTRPRHLREGGSIGTVSAFKEVLGVDSILVGVVPLSSNIHGPDENWLISTAEKTKRAFANFFYTINSTHIS